ncbi:MAG: 4'-phosphopantetheinyl transferase superfamily protein, partial [Spirochaetaceae bacterium]|nr:4'-phosphopantetheinyl transferase superfamily protein [Spirochaetaceae bacterium]
MDIVYIGLKRLSNQNEGHTQAWNALKSLAGAGEILRLSGGRPYFADLRGDFSLSHAGRLAAAAYSVKRSGATGAPLRTACDIERIHPTKDRTPLASRFFHPLEQRWLDGAANRAERQRRFYSLWTLKECFLKAAGSSVFAMKGAPSCVGEAGALKPRIGCGLL